MKAKIWGTLSVAIAAGALTLLGGAPANAATAAHPVGVTVTAAQAIAATQAQVEMEKIRPALTTNTAGVIQFDAKRALALGASPSVVSQVGTGIAAAGGTTSGILLKSSAVKATGDAAVAAKAKARCYGSNSYSTQWFGKQLKINSCVTSAVIGALSAGAGVAGVIAIITSETGIGGIAAGVVAGILAIGAGAIAICGSGGNGASIDLSYAGFAWCAGQ